MSEPYFPTLAAGFQTHAEDETRVFVRVLPGAGSGDANDAGVEAGSGLRALGETLSEYWVSPTPVRRGAQGAWRYAHNDGALFAWLPIDDSSADDMAYTAYTQAFALMDELGFPHLVRVWHTIPGLNAREGDGVPGVRYAAFCRGRRRALASDTRRGLCAATVIGTHSATGLLLFVASRAVTTAIENLRQTSAHEYPQVTPADRPLFARATAVPGGWFVSGTASIVGSESVAAGDTAAEFNETLRNIGRRIEAAGFSFGEMAYMKAYLSDPERLDVVRAGFATVACPVACPIGIFHGDICRAELTFEAEALFRRA